MTAGTIPTAPDRWIALNPLTVNCEALVDGDLHRVCIIGMGPRGLSVLERLVANARTDHPGRPLEIHTVDPHQVGAGAVWRVDQSRQLLMNTVASQVSIYTDAECRIDGPVEPGPSLYDWSRAILREPGPDDAGWLVAEARRLGPDSYPTRAFYGAYLRSCADRVLRRSPEYVVVRHHATSAVALVDVWGEAEGPQAVQLADGTWLTGLDAVVLAQGHLPTRLRTGEQRIAALAREHGLRYVTPANPADVALADIAPGEPVLLRGLGLCFFDYLALLTEGRGGVFARSAGRLTYRPSGREPRLFATSRRGVPYHARGDNEKGVAGRHHPRILTPHAIMRLREAGPIDFRRDLWPLIRSEVESVYYETLLRRRGDARAASVVESLLAATSEAARSRVLDDHGVSAADRFDWVHLSDPWRGRAFSSPAELRSWLVEYLRGDIRNAREGNVSNPLKAALDVLRDIRNEVRLAVDHAGLDGVSHRDDLDAWYTPLNAFLSIGPPASRVEELVALIEAGVVEVVGPRPRICLDTDRRAFLLRSPVLPDREVRVTTLVEARLPVPDVRNTADPLLQHLVAAGQAVPYVIPSATGTPVETTGLAVTPRPARMIGVDGTAHPRRFAYGVPTEATHWVTAAGIRPYVDSVTLADSDAIARAVLSSPSVRSYAASRPDKMEVLV